MNAVGANSSEMEVYEPPAPAALAVAPEASAQDLVQRLRVIREAMEQAMEPDVDYGIIPGTNKPALLKPGSEKLAALFQLDVQLENEKIWHDDGHLTVISRATIYHQPTQTRLGSGEGICTSKEAKYAFRNAARVCPACGAAAIIKGKEEYGGGWLCWKNHKTTPGCGAKYQDGDPAIEGQAQGKVANDAIADSYNTVDKMASKRARIDAVLAVTGASALFTQDVEDTAGKPQEAPGAAASPKPTDHQPENRVDGRRPAEAATTWPVWEALMKEIGVKEPNAWLAKAVEAFYGNPSLKELTEKQRKEALAQANTAYVLLYDDGGTLEPLGVVTDERLIDAFSSAFGGIKL